MEIGQIQSFLAVVETGTIGGAAKRVFLSQPAVSMQIRQMEQELGEKLFDRKRSLSPAARAFVEFLKQMFLES